MSNQLRIKGQDVVCTLTKDGAIIAAIRNVRNFNCTVKIDQKTEDYLGETAPQFDEIFNGIWVSFSMHMSYPKVFDFINSIIRRARRNPADIGVQFNVTAVLNFPNGEKRKVVCNDLFFGNFPIQFGSRADYGEISVDASGADFLVVGSL